MSVFGFSDSFHIIEPMISGTPLTAWVVAPIYIFGYSAVILAIELIRNHKNNTNTKKENTNNI